MGAHIEQNGPGGLERALSKFPSLPSIGSSSSSTVGISKPCITFRNPASSATRRAMRIAKVENMDVRQTRMGTYNVYCSGEKVASMNHGGNKIHSTSYGIESGYYHTVETAFRGEYNPPEEPTD